MPEAPRPEPLGRAAPTGFVVQEIWRYPVKSMRGEQLAATEVTAKGVAHDRTWAVRDEKTQTLRGAKHLPKLMLCDAAFLPDTLSEETPQALIRLPDGAEVCTNDPRANGALSALLGREVTLQALRPASDADHYRMKDEAAADLTAEWRRIFMLEDDEPMPDLRRFGPQLLRELSEFISPRGAYFDVFPINLLTDASLRRLGQSVPGADLDVRRFRPNFFLAGAGGARLAEEAWVGREVVIGGLRLDIVCRAPRCVMTSHAQQGLPRDPEVIRTLVREFESCLSVYANVTRGGMVRLGDPVAVTPETVTS